MNGDVSWNYLNKIAISTAFLAAAPMLVPWVPEDFFLACGEGRYASMSSSTKGQSHEWRIFEQKYVHSSGYYKELTETGNHEVTGTLPIPPHPPPRPVMF